MPETTPPLEVIPLDQQISRQLKAFRQRRGLTQVQFAKLAGTHAPLIAKIESGRANPTAALTQHLFHALGYDATLRILACPYSGRTQSTPPVPPRSY